MPQLEEYEILAVELCQLMPTELDTMVGELRDRGRTLPYTSRFGIEDAWALARAILETESLGDAIALVHRHSTEI